MVDAQTVLNELNLDDTPENETLMTNLLSQSSAVIMGALPNNVDQAMLNGDPLYERAIITLATQFYYDRTLERGMSLGLKMLINHLVGKYNVQSSTKTTGS